MESGIIQNNIRIEQLRLQQEQLKEQRTEKVSSLKFSIDELLQRITEEHTMWFQKYHVLAEANGILELNSEIALGKNLKAGSLIGYVLPNLETTDKYIKAIVPTAGIGKIETDDKCIIRFNAYPHKEYGSLETSVTSITSIPLMNSEDELMYEIRINLPETMVTDYGTEIPYRPNMDAGIQIITESKSIIERIFDQILSIIKNT